MPAAPSPSAASSPTAGSSTAHSTTTSGPSTKTTSSTTASQAYALGTSAGRSRRAQLQRARTHEPSWLGQVLITRAQTSSTHTGADVPASATRPTMPTADRASVAGSTRRCPMRSTRRESPGPSSAMPTAYAALTRPARAYELRRSSTSSTVPIPSMAIGSRPTRAETLNASAPEVRSSGP